MCYSIVGFLVLRTFLRENTSLLTKERMPKSFIALATVAAKLPVITGVANYRPSSQKSVGRKRMFIETSCPVCFKVSTSLI
jgi:hypothetical protein